MVKIANTIVDNKNIPYIKIGDTLNIPVDWVDSETGECVSIDSNVTIECTFLTSYGVEFFPDIIIDPDQLNRKGKFQISWHLQLVSTKHSIYLQHLYQKQLFKGA